MKFTRSLSFETGPASPRTIAIVLGVVAILFGLVTIFVAVHAHRLDTEGLRTNAEVVGFVDVGDNQESAQFRFTDVGGTTHVVRDRLRSTSRHYDTGEHVTLVYHPGDPASARPDSAFWLYLPAIGAGLASLGFAAGSLLAWRFRRHLQKDYQRRLGTTVVTRVNSDGAVVHSLHNSEPLFRWIGNILAVCGCLLWIAALYSAWRLFSMNEPVFASGLVAYLALLGTGLLTGAIISLRRARLIRSLRSESGLLGHPNE